ncbi:MAG: hypothetical protein ACN2B6_00915 [Rickettsiales bacterium]
MPLAEELFRARLNYQDVQERNPEWDNVMINDYLGIGLGSSVLVEQVDQNTVDITINASAIEDNSQEIGAIIARLGAQLSLITKNSDNISQNVSDINVNSQRIDDLEQLVNRL